MTEEKKETVKSVRKEITMRIIATVSTALALVAGLFWQTAINDTIKTFIPVQGVWQYEIVIAFLVTILAAVTIYFLNQPPPVKQ